MRNAVDLVWWRRALALYGVLSLSSMAGMSIGGGIFIAASLFALAYSWTNRDRNFAAFRHPLIWASLAIFFTAFLSLAAAAIWPPMGEAAGGFKELKKFHHFLYPPLIAMALLYSADEAEKHPFWKFWGAMGIFSGFLAIFQFFGSDLFPAAWLESRFFRPVGETGRFHGQGLMFFHLSFAACMTFVAAAGIARVLWPLKWDSARSRLFWAAVGLFGFVGVFLSYSRISLAGLAAVVIALGFLKRPKWGLVAIALSLVLGITAWNFSSSLRDRFLISGGANIERKLMWQASWDMFKDRPLAGFGFARSAAYTPAYTEKILGSKPWFTSHAHNNFLDTLASTGILGLLAFLWWWLVLLYASWKSFVSAKEKWLPAAALAALLAFQVNGLTQVNFWDGKSQHTLMIWAGIILALDLRRRKEEEKIFRRP